jgi:dolichyl-phosphate beta-glucosyltransferase
MIQGVEGLRHQLQELAKELLLRGIERKKLQLSIVVPAYNEKKRLPGTILNTIRWCQENLGSYEIIIVDDGSSDETLEMAKLFEECDGNVRALACPHLGKGAAVRMGMLNARGERVLFMDADGATPLDEIPKLMRKLGEGYPIAIGSRVVTEDSGTTVENTALRKLTGRIFANIVKLFGVKGISDTQCGFKMFRRDVANALFLRQKIEGFAFDVEILYLARRLSFPVAEVPVNWIDQKGSKVSVARDSIKMLLDVSMVRWVQRKAQI